MRDYCQSELDLREITVRALHGSDHGAFELLHKRYHHSLLHWAQREKRVPHVDEHDLVQYGWLSIWKSRQTYNPDDSFETWAREIVRNSAISAWRYECAAKRDFRSTLSRESLTLHTECETITPETIMMYAEFESTANRAVDNLKNENHVIVLRTELDGQYATQSQAATALNMTSGAYRSMLNGARMSARNQFRMVYTSCR